MLTCMFKVLLCLQEEGSREDVMSHCNYWVQEVSEGLTRGVCGCCGGRERGDDPERRWLFRVLLCFWRRLFGINTQ